MKRKIRNAFEQDTPDVWSSIVNKCSPQPAAKPAAEAPRKKPMSIWADDNPKPRRELPAFWQNVWEFASTAALLVFCVGAIGGILYLFSIGAWQNPTLATTPSTSPTHQTNPSTQPSRPTEKPTQPSQPTERPTEPTPPPTTEPTIPTVTDPTPPPTTEPTPPPTTEPTQPTIPQIEIVGTTDSGIPIVKGIRISSNGFYWSEDGKTVFAIHKGYIEMLEPQEINFQFTYDGYDFPVTFQWCQYDGEIGIKGAVYSANLSAFSVYPILGNTQYVSFSVNDPYHSEDKIYLLNLETLEISDPFGDARDHFSSSIIDCSFSSDLKWALFECDNMTYVLNIQTGEYSTIEEFTGIPGANEANFISNSTISVWAVQRTIPQEWTADAWVYSLDDGSYRALYTELDYGWLIDVGGVEGYGQMHIHNHRGGKGVCVIDCATGIHHLTGLPTMDSCENCGIGKVLINTANRDIEYLVSTDGTATPVFSWVEDPREENLDGYPKEILDLTPDVWHPNTEFISCEEYFSIDRTFVSEFSTYNRTWVSTYKGKQYLFEAIVKDTKLIIRSDAFANENVVADNTLFKGATCIVANGKYAFLEKDERLLIVDLLTGKVQQPDMGYEECSIIVADKNVIYYATYEAPYLSVKRYYTPEATSEHLFDIQMDVAYLHIKKPKSTHDLIELRMLNPELLQQIRMEVNNPESIYRDRFTKEWGPDAYYVLIENPSF